jgi:hypothetical protein
MSDEEDDSNANSDPNALKSRSDSDAWFRSDTFSDSDSVAPAAHFDRQVVDDANPLDSTESTVAVSRPTVVSEVELTELHDPTACNQVSG